MNTPANHCHKRYTVLVGMTAAGDTIPSARTAAAIQATKRVTRFARGRGD